MVGELEKMLGAQKDAIDDGSRSLINLAVVHVFSRVRLLDPSTGLHTLISAAPSKVPEDLASEVQERVGELVEACFLVAEDVVDDGETGVGGGGSLGSVVLLFCNNYRLPRGV